LDVLTQVVEGEDKEEWAGLEWLLRRADALNLAETHLCILHLWRARNLYRQGRFQDALQACLDAEQVLPDDKSLTEALAERFNNLGHVYETQGDYRQALTLYQKALERRTDDRGKAISHSYIGSVYRDLGHHPKAIADYEKAIDLDPKAAYLHHGLGNVYYTLGRYEEAIAEY
jgi:tetratricopeptide (TPR) repeat protein